MHPDFEAVMAWLQSKMPAESPHVSIIHNDYKFDNVVLKPANPLEITGVLDWEMATIGDPLMDLVGAPWLTGLTTMILPLEDGADASHDGKGDAHS